uniref:Transposase-associated domain-containing protein n=1 Tax=Solanum lycopersicum TaxID=4081 RepID=A0A3Q7IHA9_SOLLC
MDVVDKSWMDLRRSTDEYIHGVSDFLDKAFERATQGDEILYPCKKFFNPYWHFRNVVEDHLICHGNTPHPTKYDEPFDRQDVVDKLREGPSEDAKRFFKLVKEGKKDLYLGYQTDDDEDNQTEEGDDSSLYPKTGHPIEKSEEGQLLKLIEQEPVASQPEANGQSVEEQPLEQPLEQQPIED